MILSFGNEINEVNFRGWFSVLWLSKIGNERKRKERGNALKRGLFYKKT